MTGRTKRWLPRALILGSAVLMVACSSNSSESSSSTTAAGAATSAPAVTTGGGAGTTAAGTVATTAATTAAPSTTVSASTSTAPVRAGATRMHFEVGPLDIKPGQNNIDTTRYAIPRPSVDGWIVAVYPNLRREDGSIPPVDEIHLHHGVWLNVSAKDATIPVIPERFLAVGEEKTPMVLPAGYGYQFHAKDKWVLNYMIHNLWPTDDKVWVTYDVDFIPADSPAAAGLVPARPVWMDVQNGSGYPVFDVLRNSGTNGTYTYPDQATQPYGTGAPKNVWTVDHDGVLIATGGHLHPGGLQTDLFLQRAGATAPAGHAKAGAADTAHLFTSSAHYYEPAGAVSWDVAVTVAPPTWRVAVHQGDVMSTNATYDSARASWYESMGIMVTWMADTTAPGETAVDPFVAPVDAVGPLSHGHLPENDHHGGATTDKYHDATQLPSVDATPQQDIQDFIYGQGDMIKGDPIPTVKPGGTITFKNLDAPLENGEWHTITACKAPCAGSTGIAYPLADGDVTFDSGELGLGGAPTANRDTWTTPADLAPGTYTYFCRIHPFMRGAFRVAA